MTGITCSDNLTKGFAEFFGGPQKMQESARVQLLSIKDKLTVDLENDRGEQPDQLSAGIELINRALEAKIVTNKMLSDVAQYLMGYADAYLENFVKLEIPAGENELSMHKKIQEKLKPDPVAETGFFYMIAVIQALSEMDEHFSK